MRTPFSRQMHEVALAARSTSRTRPGRSHLRALVRPHIKGQQRAPQLLLRTDEKLQCLAGLDRRNQVHRRIENARGLASLESAMWRIRKNARQASRLAGDHV